MALSIQFTGVTVTLLSPNPGTSVSTDEKKTLSFNFLVNILELCTVEVESRSLDVFLKFPESELYPDV